MNDMHIYHGDIEKCLRLLEQLRLLETAKILGLVEDCSTGQYLLMYKNKKEIKAA
jgi:hypothetical protein